MQKREKLSAFDAAVNLISYRDRTSAELVKRLKEKEYSAPEIEYAMEKLTYYGYVDDRRYADSYIRYRSSSKGNRRIAMELASKGVDRAIVSELLAEYDRDESTDVLSILESRYSNADFSDDKTRRRVYGYFVRRGFTTASIQKAFRKLIERSI